MEAALKTWFVIINPTSGNGTSKRKWTKIKHWLELSGFYFEYAFTQYSKHSIKLVQNAINNNIKNIICIGGDGTLHNIVNGIFSQSFVSTSEINVGVIPIGTGNDWVKTHGIPKDIKKAIQIIKNGHTACQDIGRIEFLNSSKTPIYYNNLAGIGFDGFVVSKVEKIKFLGAFAYLCGAIISLFMFKNFESKTIINSKEIRGKNLMILIGLCKYSGGGMQLTNIPNPFDGLLDITIAEDLNKVEIIKNLPKLFNGKITNHKKVKLFKTGFLSVETYEKDKPFIQADGELIGTGDFKVTIIPKAFSFYNMQNMV